MKLIFVSGMKDVDRRTIVDLALQRSGRKKEFAVVDFDKIDDVSEEIENTADLETARRLLSKFYERVENNIVSSLKDQRGGMIVNGYLSFDTRNGYIRAVSDGFFRMFKPDTIVILEEYADIGERPDSRIIDHQRINRYFGTIYSSLCGSTIKILKFRENKMMEAVDDLSEIIKH